MVNQIQVLVVDSDRSALAPIHERLHALGCAVSDASDVNVGKGEVSSVQYDVVLIEATIGNVGDAEMLASFCRKLGLRVIMMANSDLGISQIESDAVYDATWIKSDVHSLTRDLLREN